MHKYFRTIDGHILKFTGGYWEAHHVRFVDSPAVGQQPLDAEGQPVPGQLLTIKKADTLLNELIETLAEAAPEVLQDVYNRVMSDRVEFLLTEGADDLYEIIEADSDGMLVEEHEFDPPLTYVGDNSDWKHITDVRVYELEGGGLFDLFDQDGTCLNEGCSFPFKPSRDEVKEYVTTGKIAGKIE